MREGNLVETPNLGEPQTPGVYNMHKHHGPITGNHICLHGGALMYRKHFTPPHATNPIFTLPPPLFDLPFMVPSSSDPRKASHPQYHSFPCHLAFPSKRNIGLENVYACDSLMVLCKSQKRQPLFSPLGHIISIQSMLTQ